MGKRSEFERVPKDKYRTQYHAFHTVLDHLDPFDPVVEPCAGNGILTTYLIHHGFEVIKQFDIEPDSVDVEYGDALDYRMYPDGQFQIVTNPPWNRKFLHPFLERIIAKRFEAWLLFDGDWLWTDGSAPYMPYCSDIVPTGRSKWIPGSKHQAKDNCAWYRFSGDKHPQPVFHPKVPGKTHNPAFPTQFPDINDLCG